MSISKKILQAALALLLALGTALAAGTWIFPEETDLIAARAGFRLSAAGIGAGISLMVMFAFADGWIGARRRTNPQGSGAARLAGGLGFGLLPAACVWKIFEQRTFLGRGAPLGEELEKLIPPEGIFTAEGRWLPGRIEAAAALALFAAVILWLVIRRQPLREDQDIAGVCAAGWSAVRTVTEGFRLPRSEAPGMGYAAGWLAALAGAAVLTAWVLRLIRKKKNTGYAALCVPVYALSAAGTGLIGSRVLQTGIPAADLGMGICLAMLALKAALCAGRVGRESAPPA